MNNYTWAFYNKLKDIIKFTQEHIYSIVFISFLMKLFNIGKE